MVVEVTKELVINEPSNDNPDFAETNDITFLLDSVKVDDSINSSNKDNNKTSKEIRISIRDIITSTDTPVAPSNNNAVNANNTLSTY